MKNLIVGNTVYTFCKGQVRAGTLKHYDVNSGLCYIVLLGSIFSVHVDELEVFDNEQDAKNHAIKNLENISLNLKK